MSITSLPTSAQKPYHSTQPGRNQAAMPYVKLIHVDRCRPGRGTFIEYAGKELAVFLFETGGRIVVTDNACPHANGNLSAGELDGSVVTCPWHDWQFDLECGACVNAPGVPIQRYDCEMRDGDLWVDLPD
jgi:nitrite reductase/ring-hydroxylating ferredoxin subunit